MAGKRCLQGARAPPVDDTTRRESEPNVVHDGEMSVTLNGFDLIFFISRNFAYDRKIIDWPCDVPTVSATFPKSLIYFYSLILK